MILENHLSYGTLRMFWKIPSLNILNCNNVSSGVTLCVIQVLSWIFLRT